ncbi:MAG: hypothetical protein IPM13_01225 [Phycisphaerales bacterium]|nr:hypothetical protein [Phycisphaerales bacterium]
MSIVSVSGARLGVPLRGPTIVVAVLACLGCWMVLGQPAAPTSTPGRATPVEHKNSGLVTFVEVVSSEALAARLGFKSDENTKFRGWYCVGWIQNPGERTASVTAKVRDKHGKSPPITVSTYVGEKCRQVFVVELGDSVGTQSYEAVVDIDYWYWK